MDPLAADEPPEAFAKRCGPFAAYIAADLRSFDDWRQWDAQTLAAYVVTLMAQFARKDP